jgi:endoglucanase
VLVWVGETGCSLTTDLSNLSVDPARDAGIAEIPAASDGAPPPDLGWEIPGGAISAPDANIGTDGPPVSSDVVGRTGDPEAGAEAVGGPGGVVDAAADEAPLPDRDAPAAVDAGSPMTSDALVSADPPASDATSGPPGAREGASDAASPGPGPDAVVPPMDAGPAAQQDGHAGGPDGDDAGAPMPMPMPMPMPTSMCDPPSASSASLALGSSPAITACGIAIAELPALFVAVDPRTFDGSNACGGCVRIETAAAALEAPVVDLGASLAPVAQQPTLLVSQPALSRLLPSGEIFASTGVSWRFVSCSMAPPTMTFTLQLGSNPSYSAVLIQNHRNRISHVEYRSGNVYVPLVRSTYNYWVSSSGMGAGPFTLRITDVLSQSVEQAGVPLAPGVPFVGNVQFPPCPK